MIGSLNSQQINYLLQSEFIGRLGCSSATRTYVVPLTYVYSPPYIYAHTKEGLKTEMMRANPSVCFEVDRIDNLANWQTVIVQGRFEEMKGRKAEDALQLLINRVHPMSSSETLVPRHSTLNTKTPNTRMPKLVVFRIKIESVTGRFEKQ